MKYNDIEVNINVCRGQLSSIGDDSAVGKSYMVILLRMLQTLSKYADEILCLTYEHKRSVDAYVEEIQKFNGTYIVLDRYDLYYDDRITAALKEKVNAMILVDLKTDHYMRMSDAFPVELIRDGDKIEVREYVDVIRG